MSRKGKVALGIGIGVCAVVLIVAAAGGIYAWRFTSGAKKITLEDVDVSRVPDGRYRGRFSLFHVSADVEVTVRDGKVTGVELVEGDANREKMEPVIDQVIRDQSIEVDTVSGATVSTKVLLKAIENALNGGR